jgi:Carboxypeptidase regulatory-like domain
MIDAGRAVAFAALLFAAASAASAQISIGGRVVESGTGQRIAGATVEIRSVGGTTTDDQGEFRFTGVQPGRYALTVTAIGYLANERALIAARDTTLEIELEVRPIALDTLGVTDRRITVKGIVEEAGTGLELIDVDVSLADRTTRTDAIGRFRFSRVPVGPDVGISIRGFGYLPVDTLLQPERDTTLHVVLRPDPVAQRMIARQVERIEQRGHGRRTLVMPALDREDLLRLINITAYDVVRIRYGQFLSRVACIMIDDVQKYNGLEELYLLLPDRLQRIEVLFDGKMLRIYTRDYIRRMTGGGVTLKSPVYVPARVPYCQ